MRKTTVAAAGLLAAACAAAAVRADQPGKAKAVSDEMFVKEAVHGGLAEVKLGQLAQEHASSAAVRKFGERMVEDHTRANKEFMALLKQKAMAPPDKGLSRKDQELYDRLSKMRGDEFDRAYMQHMVKDHEEDVALFQSMAAVGRDADLKAFAVKTLPVLKEHLQMARKVAASTGKSER
jgi:putative membrane protein